MSTCQEEICYKSMALARPITIVQEELTMPSRSISQALRVICTSTLTILVGCVLAVSVYAQKSKSGFPSFIVGNPADAQPSQNLSPGLVLMGGGTDVDA